MEAWAAGLPVIAWRPSSSAALIEEVGGGIAVSWDQSVPSIISMADRSLPAMRIKARQLFSAHFSEDVVLSQLLAIYRRVLSSAPNSLKGS
jgi:glycosyltransferase involved in cell wall biosynthesis